MRLPDWVAQSALVCLMLPLAWSACERDLADDICPQREGYDDDCESRCLAAFPLRIQSVCRLRSEGTLLSFFGIRSFACRCVLPSSFCDGTDLPIFSLPAIRSHSSLSTVVSSCSSSLSCESFTDCGWRGSKGADWFQASPNTHLPFGEGESPNGDYLVGIGREGVPSLSIDTCDGLCSSGSVNVSFRMWRSPWIRVELCFREHGVFMCAPVSTRNGRITSEVLPQTESFAISIRFSNVTDGESVLLDDLGVAFLPCDAANLVAEAEKNTVKETEKESDDDIKRDTEIEKEPNREQLVENESHETIKVPKRPIEGARLCVGARGIAKCQQQCKGSGHCVREGLMKKCVCGLVSSNSIDGCVVDEECSVRCEEGTPTCQSGECACDVHPCRRHTCSFDNVDCEWRDLHSLTPQFNRISIASKKGQGNRYGLSHMRPRSYSGIVRRGAFSGPIHLTVDVFPSHSIEVRICVNSLRVCQSQKIEERVWNRVTARIRITSADKIFLLFYNKAAIDKTIAIDNLSIRTGACP